MSKWASEQPKDGDVVLHCGHLHDGPDKSWHWWRFVDGPMTFRRPDGTAGEAQWQVACDSCFRLTGGEPSRIPIMGDGRWKGDEPTIPAAD